MAGSYAIMTRMDAADLEVRRHSSEGTPVIVLHGGPGAPGSATELAKSLTDGFSVVEPLQRRSSGEPLTVASHIADLDRIVTVETSPQPPALVGESWGAMLALAYAAEQPDKVSSIALVGCGTFDQPSRAAMLRTLEERTDDELQLRLAAISREAPDASAQMARAHVLMDDLYTYERASEFPVPELQVDAKGHSETWADMLRLQSESYYPHRFERIVCPVRMFHGDFDPHPGTLIRDNLKRHIPQLSYIRFERCGHSPWVEEHARRPFVAALREWLSAEPQ